jgi:hypothetical protein
MLDESSPGREPSDLTSASSPLVSVTPERSAEWCGRGRGTCGKHGKPPPSRVCDRSHRWSAFRPPSQVPSSCFFAGHLHRAPRSRFRCLLRAAILSPAIRPHPPDLLPAGSEIRRTALVRRTLFAALTPTARFPHHPRSDPMRHPSGRESGCCDRRWRSALWGSRCRWKKVETG